MISQDGDFNRQEQATMQLGRKLISFIMVFAIALAPLAGTASMNVHAVAMTMAGDQQMADPCPQHPPLHDWHVQGKPDTQDPRCCCDKSDHQGCKGGSCNHHCMQHATSPAIADVPVPSIAMDVHLWRPGLEDAVHSWHSPPFTKPPRNLR